MWKSFKTQHGRILIDPAIFAATGHHFTGKTKNKKIKNADVRVWGDARGDQKQGTLFGLILCLPEAVCLSQALAPTYIFCNKQIFPGRDLTTLRFKIDQWKEYSHWSLVSPATALSICCQSGFQNKEFSLFVKVKTIRQGNSYGSVIRHVK